MSQQFGIMIMIDVKAALKTNCLSDHVYLIDNMRDFGSKNEGTNALISKVNGTHWYDGKQAGEEVMNWLALDINDLPRTVQKAAYYKNKSTEQLLKNLVSDINRKKSSDGKDIATKKEDIDRLFKNQLEEIELKAKGLHVNTVSNIKIRSDRPLINTKGQLIEKLENNVDSVINHFPIVTNITGEAVDQGIIFAAQYGSPNFSTEGWYWCATVSTATPGQYSYTVHVTLFNLVQAKGNKPAYWEPIEMTFDSSILISSEEMKNGFTGGGDYYLPIQ